MFDNRPIPKPQQVKKFYFLDYFFILLLSCESHKDKEEVFLQFRTLKDKERLGESKYKKLTVEESNPSLRQVQRFKYTFNQVLVESANYELIINKKDKVIITDLGRECLKIGLDNKRKFYLEVFSLMEKRFFAFYHLVQFCYEQNKSNNGVLIFPVYSPLKLGYLKENMKFNSDWYDFILSLKRRLEKDIRLYLKKNIDLKPANDSLILKLNSDGILEEPNLKFDEKKYNAIINRIRKYWLNYFLKDIYNYNYSFDVFNIWVERGKQLGIIHSSEVYPDFDGRLVYPTSIIVKNNSSSDFDNIFSYEDSMNLLVHNPSWNKMDSKKRFSNQEVFVENLLHTYYDIKKTRRTQFIRLSDLREKVCYKMRIPTFVFNIFLEKSYFKNLRGELAIQISLEADRLPQETTAMYLKREPVLINNQYKNIIAIDYKKN